MLESLIFILILGLVLYVIYWVAGQFVQGVPIKIIGAVLALIFVIIALQKIGVLGSGGHLGHV